MKTNIKETKKNRFKPINLPVYQIDFLRLDDIRLKKGISLRTLKLCLSEKYNVYTSRNFINDFFRLRRCPSTCKASFFIAIADILGVSMNDYILKANQTESDTIIHNSQNEKKTPVEGLKKTTKNRDVNKVEYSNGVPVGSWFVKERCVF